MRGLGRPFSSLAILIALAIIAFSQQQPANPSAEDVVIKWRHAVHAERQEHSKLAVLANDSNQDGLQGLVEEWITTSPIYRGTVKREYDDGEVVVTGQFAKRRDWNAFVRDVQGKELARLRTQTFEKSAIIFGPPIQMPEATVSQSDDKKMYLLRTTPPGAAPMT